MIDTESSILKIYLMHVQKKCFPTIRWPRNIFDFDEKCAKDSKIKNF